MEVVNLGFQIKKNLKYLLTTLRGFGIIDAVNFEYHLGCDEILFIDNLNLFFFGE